MHISVPIDGTCEFINVTSISPLISKCQIKVCYVSDEPNRNGSIITKQVAYDLAKSLPGSPIVGFYNKDTQDFEQHNKIMNFENGEIVFSSNTFPYGFIDVSPKIWFQKFIDDNSIEREYLVTEGYIWTEQFPESKRIIEQGNNQSMELDEKTLNGTWTKDNNNNPKFFIVNEAIISKLCILGEDYEPCFEGAQIKKEFSLSNDLKDKLSYMIKELKEILEEGGKESMQIFAVDIGSPIWNSMYSFFEDSNDGKMNYLIEGFFEDENGKYALVSSDNKVNKVNFNLSENNEVIDCVLDEELFENEFSSQFSKEEIENFESIRYAKNGQNSSNDDEETPKNNSEDGEENGEDDKNKNPKTTHSLEDYNLLNQKFESLTQEHSNLVSDYNLLKDEVEQLRAFKNQVDKEKKEEMINSFYMLSDEDKKDVVDHINEYSLEDIEAKLSIICVRNKVNFNLDSEESNPTSTFNLNSAIDEDDDAPAWIKAVRAKKNSN